MMNWTKDRPVTPGWYWTVEAFDDEPLLFEVEEQHGSGRLCVNETYLSDRPWDNTLWYGPIEIPRPPPRGDGK